MVSSLISPTANIVTTESNLAVEALVRLLLSLSMKRYKTSSLSSPWGRNMDFEKTNPYKESRSLESDLYVQFSSKSPHPLPNPPQVHAGLSAIYEIVCKSYFLWDDTCLVGVYPGRWAIRPICSSRLTVQKIRPKWEWTLQWKTCLPPAGNLVKGAEKRKKLKSALNGRLVPAMKLAVTKTLWYVCFYVLVELKKWEKKKKPGSCRQQEEHKERTRT